MNDELEYLEVSLRHCLMDYIRAASKHGCRKIVADVFWRVDEHGNPSTLALTVQEVSEFGRDVHL